MKVSDHLLTESHGSSIQAKIFRKSQEALVAKGNLMEALKMGIDDLVTKFGDTYSQQIKEMVESAPKNIDGSIDWSQFKYKEIKE